MQEAVAIIFLFAFGACVGSFLNVVVWRLPRVEVPEGTGMWRSLLLSWQALSYPPSHCPKCNQRLKWYDNLPVVGWIKLGGKCRYCKESISPRYPIVEAVTGGIFVFYYVMFFITQTGPCVMSGGPQRFLTLEQDWPIYVLYILTAAALLAASLIDAELFMIPMEICYFIAVLGLFVHTLIDSPGTPGGLISSPVASAMSIGGGAGLLVSLALLGRKFMPLSFPNGEVLEVDRELVGAEIEAAKSRGETPPDMPVLLTRGQVRTEIGKEMLFLLPPMFGAFIAAVLVIRVGSIQAAWSHALTFSPLAGFAGSLLGALVGAFVVWIVRILATLAFGRIAMGLGDVHLMFGVGAVLGPGAATVAFFLAPFFGIVFALYRWLSGKGREVPYGPYLSLASGLVMLFYCPIHEYLRPGMEGLMVILSGRAW